MTDLVDDFVRGVIVNNYQLGALDVYLRFGVDQMDAVNSRGCPLVKLAREILDSDELAHALDLVRDRVRHDLSEHAVAAFLQKLRRETE